MANSQLDVAIAMLLEERPPMRVLVVVARVRGVRVHLPRTIDVKAERVKVGMTQERFAARFGFSMATLRHWERGDRTPRGPALVLLKVIERNPQAVIEALV